MNRLLFFANKIQSPSFRQKINIPLEFISFGIIEGKTYRYFENKDNFVIPTDSNKKWGNSVVYGSLFLCKDFDFYGRILDSYHLCSMSTLLRNHINDINHRVEVNVTPIYFDTLDELERLKYREGKEIKAQTYLSNTNHPKIKRRISGVNTYRIYDGINAESFKELFWEVTKFEE